MHDREPHRFVRYENWEEVYAELIESLEDEEHWIQVYEYQWQLTRREPHCPKDRNLSARLDDEPVGIYRTYMEMGLIPPPEVLLVIDSMLETYFSHRGDLSLEDVFFGKSKRGVGNFAARHSKKHDGFYSTFHFEKMFLSDDQYGSEVERAEAFLAKREQQLLDHGIVAQMPEVDTFLRQARRWHKQQVADT